MEVNTVKSRRKGLMAFLGFALLFMLAAVLSACADSKLDEGYGSAGRVVESIERLCVSFADYDGSVDPKNLKAVLSVRQQDVKAVLEGKADSEKLEEGAEEEPIPLYSDDEKRELIEQEEAERAASDYEEEPLTREPEEMQPEEDAVSEAELDVSVDPEAAAVGEDDAIPEEQADLQDADREAEAELDARASADDEVETENPEDELMHGDVPSAEAVLEADNILRFYFEIDPSIYPIDVDSISVSDASKSEEESFLLEVPLNTAAQNSRAPFELSWKRALAAQARREAEARKAELSAKSETVNSGATTLTATIKLTDVPSTVPEQIVVSYFTDSNPVTQVKTLKRSNNDYTYSSSKKTIQFKLKDTAENPIIYVLSINDVTNNLTYCQEMGSGYSYTYFASFYYFDGDLTETVSYSSFKKGFTQSPTICVYNFPTWDEKDKFCHLYIKSHVLGYSSGSDYNEQSGDYFRDDEFYEYENDSNAMCWHLNLICKNKNDYVVLTGLEGPESYWEGALDYSYRFSGDNIIAIKYNVFKNNKVVNESAIGLVGKIIVTNIDFQPSDGSMTFYYDDDESQTLITQKLKGATYDKATQTLVAYVSLTSKYNKNSVDWFTVKKITLDDYVYSGQWGYGDSFWYADRIIYTDFDKFSKSGSSGDPADYSRQVHVKVADLPYNPETFKVSYTEGSSTSVKTVNVASYKNGVLTFGGIYTNASCITLKQVEAGASVYNASKRIDLSSNNAHIEVLSFDDFTKRATNSFKVYVTGVPSYKSGKVKFLKGDSYGTITSTKSSYSSADKKVTFNISSLRSMITLLKIVANNHYKNLNYRIGSNGASCSFSYGKMSAESVSYCQSVTGVSTKPNSARLSYVLYNDSAKTYTVSGTYDSSAQKVNFRFKAKEDVVVKSIVINGKLCSKAINLTYPSPTNTIKYASMNSTRLVVKNVSAPVNYIMIKYKLYNSSTGAYSSSTYKKTAGTYSSANETYTFPFTLSLLNGSDYDTVIVKSVALNNSVSTTERTVNLGKTYNLLSSGLKAQSTRYSVNVYSGTTGVKGKTGTMKYTLNGTSYTAKGTVEYDSDHGRYVMHFETLKTKATSVKINKVTVGNKYYGSSFTLKYGQNKANSSALEGLNTINTRTLNMASGFKS